MIHPITICVAAVFIIVTVGACGKKQVPETKTIWRTKYIRDTSTLLCNKITIADSAIVYMDHLFIPMYSNTGINFNLPLEQSVKVQIPGIASGRCIISEYFCPTSLIGKDVEVAFALFAHPTQLEEWRALSKDFDKKKKEWNMYIHFDQIFCGLVPHLTIKKGKIIRAG